MQALTPIARELPRSPVQRAEFPGIDGSRDAARSPAEGATPGRREIRSLTGLRGVAACFVVLFHYIPEPSTKHLLGTLIGHGYLAVDLFFVLSGFVMMLTYRHLFQDAVSLRAYLFFLQRRLARIYPLYLVCLGIGGAFCYVGLLRPVAHALFPLRIAQHLFMVQTWLGVSSFLGPAWSISAEWAAYLLFPLLVTFFVKPGFSRALISLLVVAAAVVLCVVLLHGDARTPVPYPWFILDRQTVLRCLCGFFLGMVTCSVAETRSVNALVSRPVYTDLIVLLIAGLLFVYGADLAIVALFPVLLLGLLSDRSLTARLLGSGFVHFLGLVSYSLYLIHELFDPLIRFIHSLVSRHGHAHGQTVAAVVAFTLTFLFSIAAYRFIEIPGRRWLQQLGAGHRG